MNDPKRPDDRDEADSGAGGGAAGDARDAGGRRADSHGDPRGGDRRARAAWRSLSNEEPPAALDAALRAAARREVGARVKPAAVPEATRPERWWFPLAAAATIGAIAIGLLQVVMPERMGEPGGDARSVSDVPPGAKSVEMPAAKPTVAPPVPAARPTVPPAPPAAGVTAESDGASGVTPPAPSSAKVEAHVPSRGGTAVPSRATAPQASAPTAASTEAARRDGTPQPFPAITEMPSGAPAPKVGDSPAAAPVPPPAPRPAPLAASPAPSGVAVPSPAANAAQTAAPMAKLGAAREQGDRASAPRAADLAEGAASASRARGEIGQRAAELPVPEWIALIRRLRDEGKFADVDRELKAFRTAHPDHLTLLPPDLRDWRLSP